MVEMSDTISFIEKLAERRSQLIQRAADACDAMDRIDAHAKKMQGLKCNQPPATHAVLT